MNRKELNWIEIMAGGVFNALNCANKNVPLRFQNHKIVSVNPGENGVGISKTWIHLPYLPFLHNFNYEKWNYNQKIISKSQNIKIAHSPDPKPA